MAYLFDGVDDYLTFAPTPFVGWVPGVGGPLTVACMVNMDSVTVDHAYGAVVAGASKRAGLDYIKTGTQFEVTSNNTRGRTKALTASTWWLLAGTYSGVSGALPRLHWHDGSSWGHGDAVSGISAAAAAITGTAVIRVGRLDASAPLMKGAIACIGMKRADSNDATIETLSRTLFQAWLDFGFDWLAGLQTSATQLNRANPGSGDETARVGTTLVADPPGWTWPSTGTTYYGVTSTPVTFGAATAGTEIHYGALSTTTVFGAVVAGVAAGPPAVAPVAAFSADPLTTPEIPYFVEFTDLSTNTPTSWDWDFGDGTPIVHLQNPAHEYTVAGTYTVTLTVHNSAGTDSEAKTGYVNVTAEDPLAPGPGIRLAPNEAALVADPLWQRIDVDYRVQSWSIDRGRQNEMSRTETGTATIELVDRTGDFDPTNPSGAFSSLAPMAQAAISLQNPVTDAWSTLFRGFVAAVRWTPYASEQHANVTLDLVDGLAVLAACEMAPDGSFGDGVDQGNIVFAEDLATDAVQTRINLALDQANWPASLRSIFTGNVKLQGGGGVSGAGVYPPRATVLSVIQDAADAEFPEQSNVYVGGPKNPGMVVFHGRYARFHPDVVEYHIHTWQAGDDQAAQASPATVVRISPPLTASKDDTLLFTSALATPQGIDEDGIEGQYVTDDPAVAANGLRTWSAENLATAGGAGGTTAAAETKLFADYVRDNYSTPKVRVGQLTVKSRRPDSVYAAATWKLLCEIDISDIVHLNTTHGGGGGFDDDFYVEGIHYTARPGGGVPYVELTLDVSPRGYYDSNPFES